jgi:hypothetical protein
VTETKYLLFDHLEGTDKNQTWNVLNKKYGTLLGVVTYYSGWRQYTFVPSNGTEFNNSCLLEIVGLLDKLNAEAKHEQNNAG